jgi:hypothetical protein
MTTASTLQMVIAGDGKVVGHLLSRGVAGIEAFDIADCSLGLFPTQHEAADALLKERSVP